MFETAQTNAIQRVVFMRWFRRGLKPDEEQAGVWGHTGKVWLNFSDDDSRATIKTEITVGAGPEAESLVHSIAALNGLKLERELRSEDGRWAEEWDTGPDTPRLHKWVGYRD